MGYQAKNQGKNGGGPEAGQGSTEEEQFSRKGEKREHSPLHISFGWEKCQVCHHLLEGRVVQERARTGEAAVPSHQGLAAGSWKSSSNWGEAGGHGKEILYEKYNWVS